MHIRNQRARPALKDAAGASEVRATADRTSAFIRASLLVLPLLALPIHLQASEAVVLKVFLNTEDKGDYFMRLTPEGDVLLPRKDFLGIGFRDVPAGSASSTEHERFVSLRALAPLVTFEIDDRQSVLRITASPELLEKHIVDFAYQGPRAVLYTKETAAFFNYAVNYSAGDSFDFKALSVPWETGVSVDGTLGLSSFAYTKTDEGEKFVRLLSNVTADDRTTMRRIVIGDFSAFSGALGSGGLLGGLSVSKDFAIRPNFQRFPGLNFSGVLETPSEIELYINGMLVNREHMPAGSFQFMNLPGATGAGEATLVIKDAFGRETRVENPFYYTTQLLKPGLNDYSYNLGFKRKELGETSFDYGAPAFVGFHRYGFTRSFTGGLRAEADQHLVNIGGLATFVPWRLGETNASFAISNNQSRYGYGGLLSYSHAGGRISGGFSVSGFSREYANLGLSSSRESPRVEGSVSLGFNQRRFGSLSINYFAADFYGASDERRISLFYSRHLGRNTALQLGASRTRWDRTINEAFAAIIIFLGRGKSGNISYQVHDGKASEIASIQQNPPLGPGLGYRLLIDHSEDEQSDNEFGGNAAVQYHGPYGIYSAEANRIAGQDTYDLSASGGVTLINKSAYLTRPINDSFALVKVGDLPNVTVNYSNQEAGTTNRRGEVVVPDLISYYDNDLSIETENIPVNYEISRTRRYVSPPVRGGSIVKFPITKLQGFTGRFFIVEKGERKAAQYWGLKVSISGKPKEFTVGKNGEFYLENLMAGSYPSTLFWEDEKCEFDLTIPQSNDAMVDMGDLICEIH